MQQYRFAWGQQAGEQFTPGSIGLLESLNPTINEEIRPFNNGTQKTIDAIEFLRTERARQKRHVSINVKTVLTEINLESFVEIVKRWGKEEGMMVTPQMFEWNDSMPVSVRDKLCVKDPDRLERILDEELNRFATTFVAGFYFAISNGAADVGNIRFSIDTEALKPCT